MSTYVMSDIHAKFNKFEKMLKQINFSDNDYLLILGDNIDRGTQPVELLNYIIQHNNIESLMGNHELMMLNGLKELDDIREGRREYYNASDYRCWVHNGGDKTLDALEKENKLNNGYLSMIRKEISSWKYYKILDINTKKFVCIHAGYSYRKRIMKERSLQQVLDETRDLDKVWLRDEFYYNKGYPGTITIFGHTPTASLTEDHKFRIWHDPNFGDKINIDCGVCYGGCLACLRLDDMHEFYV